MELDSTQLQAVDYATDLGRRVVSITGPAGSGKTTIMREAIQRLQARGRRVQPAAPTGRAARRIYEATGIPALSIHKLLEYNRPEVDKDTGEPKEISGPKRRKQYPLEADDIFVDEYAMVNEELHSNLMNALKPGGRLIVFGDINQLPPIEEHEVLVYNGRSPFERLLELPSSVTLTLVHRQADGSGVLTNANRIRTGNFPLKRPDFQIKLSESPLKVLREYISDSGIDFTDTRNQIITPLRKGPLGIHAINKLAQGYYDWEGKAYCTPVREKWEQSNAISIHVGEKVICNKNTYDMRDYYSRYSRWKDDATPDFSSYIDCPESFQMLNGEIGIVEAIEDDGTVFINFGDRTVQVPESYRDVFRERMYTAEPKKQLDLAYAVTTHKMQGSECNHVVYIMHKTIFYMLNRNNFYTAITRAKESVMLITDERSWRSAARMTAKEQQALRNQRGK